MKPKPYKGRCLAASPRVTYCRAEIELRSGAKVRNGRNQPVPVRVVYWRGQGRGGWVAFRRALVRLALRFSAKPTFLPEGLIAVEAWGSADSLQRLLAFREVARMEHSTSRPFRGPQERHGPFPRTGKPVLRTHTIQTEADGEIVVRDSDCQEYAARLAAADPWTREERTERRAQLVRQLIDTALGAGVFDSLDEHARALVWNRALASIPPGGSTPEALPPGVLAITPRASKLAPGKRQRTGTEDGQRDRRTLKDFRELEKSCPPTGDRPALK